MLHFRFFVATIALATMAALAVVDLHAHAADATDVRGGLVPARLTCEWQREPTGLVEAKPRLSWIVESAGRGRVQTAWQILAATQADMLEAGAADLWDSGRVASSETLGVPYDGQPLKSGQRVFWKVRAWDEQATAGPWSSVASWTMGLLDQADWQ